MENYIKLFNLLAGHFIRLRQQFYDIVCIQNQSLSSSRIIGRAKMPCVTESLSCYRYYFSFKFAGYYDRCIYLKYNFVPLPLTVALGPYSVIYRGSPEEDLEKYNIDINETYPEILDIVDELREYLEDKLIIVQIIDKQRDPSCTENCKFNYFLKIDPYVRIKIDQKKIFMSSALAPETILDINNKLVSFIYLLEEVVNK